MKQNKIQRWIVTALAAWFCALPMAIVSEAATIGDTLNECTIGLTLKIQEDGVYQDYILVNHNYLGTGNQLLMRKNTLSYSAGILGFTESYIGEYFTSYYQSELRNYLHADFYQTIDSSVRSNIRSVTIPDVKRVYINTEDGTDYYYPEAVSFASQIFILSQAEMGGAGLRFGGSPIAYFSTNESRKSNTGYQLRGGQGRTAGYSGKVSIDGELAVFSSDAGTYFRPCFVLPPDTPVQSDGAITGAVTPVISAATASSAWGKTNTVTITATDAAQYALTTTNSAPATGWQAGNTFPVSANGTYYAWAKSSTQTVSESKAVRVTRVDTTGPAISSVTVPTGWAKSSSISITATDAQSGLSQYAVTTTNSAPSSGWQSSSSFSLTANGAYYAWAKDAAGNVSTGKSFPVSNVDRTSPEVSQVQLPTEWVASAKAVLVATDVGSGIRDYALTTENVAPSTGWQPSPEFPLLANGGYFAWARDAVGNVSIARYFYFGKTDDTPPTVTYVSVSTTWAQSNDVLINASDVGSGVALYAVSSNSSAPASGWQSSKSFSLTANGTYTAWAKDHVGNVSAGYEFKVSKVDTTKPVILSVDLSTDWANTSQAAVAAKDDGGSSLAGYAVTSTAAPPDAWTTSPNFTLSANGTYYAWAKDTAGNISIGKRFEVKKIDLQKPVITSVKVPVGWDSKSVIEITATDAGGGVAAYTVTMGGTAVPTAGWQDSNRFTLVLNGEYHAWAKDAAGNISNYYDFTVSNVDQTAPVISAVQLPDEWSTSPKAVVIATDAGSRGSEYAVTTSSAPPSTGWKASPEFSITANGIHYAWARDAVGNVSTGTYFYVSKVDRTPPTVSRVAVGTKWGQDCAVTIEATDGQSGIAAYAVTAENAAPVDGWQTEKSFILNANGTYYAWAMDHAGNVLATGYAFTVSKVDTTKPVITSVDISAEWGTASSVTIQATDQDGSGISGYAITESDIAPVNGWQTGSSFTLSKNGDYYAWARDGAGNVSAGSPFTVDKIDKTAPVITAVEIPEGWVLTADITIKAADDGIGIEGYAVTSSSVAPSNGWQTSPAFSLSANGKYFAWVKDRAGNISAAKPFALTQVDRVAPVISAVQLPEEWTAGAKAVIVASDEGAGIKEYAVSNSSTAPESGWQASPEFPVTTNGTFYAWVRDAVGNVSIGKYFYSSKIDQMPPVVNRVSIGTAWGQSCAVTVEATDGQSGIASYAVTASDAAPLDGWQSSKSFTMTANGTYYAWAKDVAGNVSTGYQFEVAKVDAEKPVVLSVDFPDAWATNVKGTIQAADQDGSGITGYAVTDTATPPEQWKTSGAFTLSINGTYYAWVKDASGNCSEPKEFEVSTIDTAPPEITAVQIPAKWESSAAIRIVAEDGGSGVTSYAITAGGSTAPHSGWQASPEFQITSNSKYYAWAKDALGNVSQGYAFTIDQVDSQRPEITKVEIPTEWGQALRVTVYAEDAGTGVAAYAVSENATAPVDGWQQAPSFLLAKNGSYFAWAKDNTGNLSLGKYFSINRADANPPTLGEIRFNTASTVATVSASDGESGVRQIYIDSGVHSGGYVQYQIPEDTRYLTVQAEDQAGNRSEEVRRRVPGWFDVLTSLSITEVRFDAELTQAVITAASTGAPIEGIVVNGKLYKGNPVTVPLAGVRYLEMQAQDVNGDRSPVYLQRVPGWADEINNLQIIGVQFSEDNAFAYITAEETGDASTHRGIRGILVNNEEQQGNPVAYEIPEGTRHLEMRAVNNDGDYSRLLIRRVPGWSEIVTTISISDVAFSDYNTRATVTATATGGDSVSGIFVNDEYLPGNPVNWKIPKEVEELHVQAVNPNGDLSAMVNKIVPRTTAKSTLKLEIIAPDWTSASRAKVRIKASDKISIQEIMAKTAEEDEWEDITSSGYITISEDTTVTASVINAQGDTKEIDLDIECFDREPPTVAATQQSGNLNIRATDKKSGVAAIYVNNVEHRGSKIYGGNLNIPIPTGATKVAIRAVDEAGNDSELVELAVQNTITAIPNIVAPMPSASPPPSPPPAEMAIPEEPSIPEPEPVPELEPEPIPEPEEPKAEGVTSEQVAAAIATAVGLGLSGAGATLWWLRRKKLMGKIVPELDSRNYDESEYGGSEDPLNPTKSNVIEFDRKIS